MSNDLIAALATPAGISALAVIRTSGTGCVEAIAQFTDKPERVRTCKAGQLCRVRLVQNGVLDDVVIAVFRTPKSYTGDDSVEIYCHGSPVGIERILAALCSKGFRLADPGEFTQRAVLAGKVDLTQAEAIHEVIHAQTALAHEMALQRLGGSITQIINTSKQALTNLMAQAAVQLDYPEEETDAAALSIKDIQEVSAALETLAATYQSGQLYQHGATVVIAGRTNAGKSALFNALLKEDRAIVSTQHGTTRDYLKGSIHVHGIPVNIYDTAGLRTTDETIEAEGIRRTQNLLEHAHLCLYLVDGTTGIHDTDTPFLHNNTSALPAQSSVISNVPIICVWSKTDNADCLPVPNGFIAVSSVTMCGISELLQVIGNRLQPEHVQAGAMINSLRQYELLQKAILALQTAKKGIAAGIAVDAVSVDIQEALHMLGEITGEVCSEDILNAVFQNFCVGK